MLAHTTYTLAAKLSSSLNLVLKKVVIASGEYLIGKVRDKSLTIPAMSILRTALNVDRESGSRIPQTMKGAHVQITSSDVVRLRYIPVKATFSITVVVPDSDSSDKLACDLIWFFEEETDTELTVKVIVEGEEVDFPVMVTPAATEGLALSRTRQEEWEGGFFYRVDFDVEVATFILKSETVPFIKTVGIDFKVLDSEVLLDEIDIT